jgi:hypothetical protein
LPFLLDVNRPLQLVRRDVFSGGSKFKKVREKIIQARTRTKSASGANTAFSPANNVRLLRRPKISPHPNFRRIRDANISVRQRTHTLQRGTRPL